MSDSIKNKADDAQTRNHGFGDDNKLLLSLSSSDYHHAGRRRPNLTKEEIALAYNRLRARKEVPTVLKLRAELGNRGSYTTISKIYWQLEDERQEREFALKENNINRDEVATLTQVIVEKAYSGNIDMVKQERIKSAAAIENIEQTKQREVEDLCGKCDDLEAKNKELTEDKDKLNAELKKLQIQYAAQHEELLKAQAKNEAYEKMLADAQERSDVAKELAAVKKLLQQEKGVIE